MSRRDELNSYIAKLQRRLQLGTWLRGVAIFLSTALLVTLALVLLLNHYAFPANGVKGARVLLLAALAAVAAVGIALPLFRLTRTRAVREAEATHVELEERLTTFHERQRDGEDPFLELLAADTLKRAQHATPASLVPENRLFALGGVGLACLGVLVWMIAAGPGFLGYGASLLWTGPKKDIAPLYAISVAPGDVAVRRNSDQLITARIMGMHPEKVQIYAHYQSSGSWEPVIMQPQLDSDGAATYQFVFAGLPENVEYYVATGPLVSPHYKVRVVDLPSVKQIRVTYKYPTWTGMKSVTEEHTGDLRAIEGTNAAVEIQMDRPLKNGQLSLDGGKTIYLLGGDANKYQGTIHMEKDGAYHVAAIDEGQPVRLSQDYFIATDKAQPPEVSINRPGGDYRASPIEEVTVGVKAADQFGLNDVRLHYSVNGGAQRDINMLTAVRAKNTDGSYTLRLEEFKLVPGDLVSLYATAKDGHSEARTDISFIQVDPFEREFSQSQQSGGGGGGAGGQNNQMEISRRQKELIAATWKQQNDKAATAKDAAATAQFLSNAQQRLRDQVMALSTRMQSRDLSEANEEFGGFEKDMQTAAAAMAPSADRLKDMQWKDALPLEQKALQALLRAEATFRKIQVAFGQQQGGGGGGANSAGRDLASLFDLELDTEKNQYETAQTASPAEQHEKEVEDALAKLDALAKRQEELADKQRDPQQSFQERWQQEMLRREAEQLQQQMEQLAKNGQGQQQSGQQGSRSSSKQSGQQSASSQGGSQSSSQQQAGGQSSSSSSSSSSSVQNSDQRIEQALSRLRQAGEVMKRSGTPQQNTEAARQAADRLHEATNLMGGAQQQLATGKLGSLSREADRLSQEERTQADRINQFSSRQNTPDAMDRDAMMERLRERGRLATERQELSNDLSKLQRSLLETAREMAYSQPDVSKKLRDALTQMDESDLDNHVQRSADWLRSGINPNSNGAENEIAQGLDKLSQQLRRAQEGVGQGKSGQQPRSQGDETAILGQVERLRRQLEAMTASGREKSQGQGVEGQNSSRDSRGGQQAGKNQQGSVGQQSNRDQQAGSPSGQNQQGRGQQSSRNQQAGGQQPGQSQQGGGQQSGRGQPMGQQQAGGLQGGRPGDRFGQQGEDGYRGRIQSGAIRNGGGGADGPVWDNMNTGNNRYGQARQQPVPTDASGNPADVERTYRQGMHELSQLSRMTQGDPQAAKGVRDLARQMQQLDPARFPGNPAIVDQMQRELLGSLDRIELQLQRKGDAEAVRTGKPSEVPEGYRDIAAEYYKRLSKNP